MKLSGDYTFAAPKDLVWEALMDPEVLARVMPGCEKLEAIGENEYEAVLKIKVGPVQGKFNGGVTLLDINKPDSYRMKVSGKGPAGFMNGEGAIQLEAEGNSTRIHYEGQAQVGGKIASVGQRLMDSSAKALTKQSLDGLNKQIMARVETAGDSGSGGGEDNADSKPPLLAAVEAPSQTEFAAGVAKNMLDEIIPPSYQPIAIVLVLIVIAIILYAIFV